MEHMRFCNKCNELSSGSVCPNCGGETRLPDDNDLCFLCELDEFHRSMYVDALSNNDIDFVSVPVHGGYSQLNKPSSYKLYVKFADYGAAFEIYGVVFGYDEQAQPIADDDPPNIIDRLVKVIVDRPLGSVHHEHPDVKYELNYGHVEDVTGGDGEEQDAYIIGVDISLPRTSAFDGYVVAVIVRKNDVETKWVVAPVYAGDARNAPEYTREQIAKAVHFQEKYFDIEIIM